ncbi:MAG: VCBS repeat-containing protein [Proteobacteria bacterium]|nr:VCBS repeat-containing protein [Pseudomonadota bacterium]
MKIQATLLATASLSSLGSAQLALPNTTDNLSSRPGAATEQVQLFADYDGDGRQDVLVLQQGATGRLLKAGARGVFREVGSDIGLDLEGVYEAEWLDYDGDGDPDLFVSREGQSFVYRNQGGSFSKITISLNPAFVAPSPSAGSSGLTFGYSCILGIEDAAAPGVCLGASSTPSSGKLFPISIEWFVDSMTGFMGVLNTLPSVPLDVNGAVRSRSGGFELPDGSVQATATLLGDAGAAGPDGQQGPQGETGPVGSQGPQGQTGPQGPQGATGSGGLQGWPGPTGPTGSAGPAGADGPGFSSPQYISVGRGDYVSQSNYDRVLCLDSIGNGGSYITSDNNALVGAFRIPVGSTITQVRFRGYDASTSSGIRMRLRRFDWDSDSSSTVDGEVVLSSGSGGSFSITRSYSHDVVEGYDYVVYVEPENGKDWSSSGLLQVNAAVIRYTLP